MFTTPQSATEALTLDVLVSLSSDRAPASHAHSAGGGVVHWVGEDWEKERDTDRYPSLTTPRSGEATVDISVGEFRQRFVSGEWDGRMELERQCRPGREM